MPGMDDWPPGQGLPGGCGDDHAGQPAARLPVSTGTAVGSVVLSVVNTGPVIPPDDVARLLRPFQRRGAGRTGNDGPGLGLSIIAAIAEARGGWRWVDTMPGVGLSVWAGFRGLI